MKNTNRHQDGKSPKSIGAKAGKVKSFFSLMIGEKEAELSFTVWNRELGESMFNGNKFTSLSQLEDALREEFRISYVVIHKSVIQGCLDRMNLELLMSDGRAITNLDRAAEAEFKNPKK